MAMEANTFRRFHMNNELPTERDLIARSSPAAPWREVLRTHMAKSAPQAGLFVIHVALRIHQRRSSTASVGATRTRQLTLPCPSLPAFDPLATALRMKMIIRARTDCPAQLSTLVDLGIGA
ncbi:MAG: hypothetical protein R3F08_06550 [Dokdonella sp.]